MFPCNSMICRSNARNTTGTGGVVLTRFDNDAVLSMNVRENGPLVELNTLLDPLSCIFELGTSKYIIIPCMVFGGNADMLELCPVLSQTPVGDLSFLHRQPKIPEASDLRPNFRKNMVSYPPPPNPDIAEKPVSWRFRKGRTYPSLRNNIFPKISPDQKILASLTNRPPPPCPTLIYMSVVCSRGNGHYLWASGYPHDPFRMHGY